MTFALVSGASGGIGQHLVSAMQQAGTDYSIIRGRLLEASKLQEELNVLPALPQTTPICLYLLASMASRAECEAQPDKAHAINVTGNTQLFEMVERWAAFRGHPLGVFFASTSHVYAATEPGRLIRESDPLLPRSVYATTKLKAEESLQELSLRTGRKLVVGRIFGVIGPGQRSYLVLPGLINRVRQGQYGPIPGLHNTRDYMDIRDAARAILSLMASTPQTSNVTNICSGDAITIDHLFKLVVRNRIPQTLPAPSLSVAAPTDSHDIQWIVGDPSRLRSLVGNSPTKTPIEKSVIDAWHEDL